MVLIVADIRLYRDGLAHILRRERGMRVAAVAGTRKEALGALREARSPPAGRPLARWS